MIFLSDTCAKKNFEFNGNKWKESDPLPIPIYRGHQHTDLDASSRTSPNEKAIRAQPWLIKKSLLIPKVFTTISIY